MLQRKSARPIYVIALLLVLCVAPGINTTLYDDHYASTAIYVYGHEVYVHLDDVISVRPLGIELYLQGRTFRCLCGVCWVRS